MPPETKRATALDVRQFQPADESAISEILQHAHEAAHWPPQSYAKLAQSHGGIVLVCEAGAHVAGFIAARQAADEAEILNVAVRRDFRRKGVASALLLAAFDTFRRSSIARVFLELRESNQAARALYERHGFVLAGRRKLYYRDPPEDALGMLRKFTDTPD
jgi:ribosomal-protein-alanine N-acetyltransferase